MINDSDDPYGRDAARESAIAAVEELRDAARANAQDESRREFLDAARRPLSNSDQDEEGVV